MKLLFFSVTDDGSLSISSSDIKGVTDYTQFTSPLLTCSGGSLSISLSSIVYVSFLLLN
jgi:hypothetical protein